MNLLEFKNKKEYSEEGRNVFESYISFCAKNEPDSLLKKLYDNLSELQKQMEKLYKDRTLDVFLFKNDKGITHAERIVAYIEKILLYKTEDDIYCSHCDLSATEIMILLYSVYMHDLGKIYWSILIDVDHHSKYFSDEEREKIKEKFTEDITADKLGFEHWHLIEEFHARILNVVVDKYMEHKVAKQAKEIIEYLTQVSFITPIHVLGSYRIDENGNITETKGESFLEYVKLVSIHHEGNELNNLEDKNACRLKLLASFLVAGDHFDTDRNRINQETLRTRLVENSRIPENILAIWLMFYFTSELKLIHQENLITVEISYKIPTFLNKDKFLFVRSFIERDFYNLHFLQVVQEVFEKTEQKKELKDKGRAPELGDMVDQDRIPFRLRYSVRINEGLEIGGEQISDVKESIIRKIAENEFPKISQKITEKMKEDIVSPFLEVTKNRYKWMISSTVHTISDFIFPTELSVLYLTTLFWNYPTEKFPLKEIIQKTCIDEATIKEICNDLIGLNIVELEDSKYVFGKPIKQRKEQIKFLIEEYRANPLGLKAKIDEIKFLCHVLPFSLSPPENIIQTDIVGLNDHVLKDPSKKGSKGGFLHDRCILIEGAPGSGKTTLSMQILYNNYKSHKNVAFLTFEEDKTQLIDDFKDFGWKVEDIVIPLSSLKKNSNSKATETEDVVKALTFQIDQKAPEIIVIDSVSRFRELAEDEGVCRRILRDFLSILRIRGITILCLGEESEEGEKLYKFEEYLADGIIKLTYKEGKRFLEIIKLRGQYYSERKHPFQIYSADGIKRAREEHDIDWLKIGINLFPNLETYSFNQKEKRTSPTYLSTGIDHLDELLPRLDKAKGEGGFLKGSTILVVGSPGTGKTLLGLYFCRGRIKDLDNKNKCLWISFEGTREQIRKSVDGFVPEKVRLLEIINNDRFIFHYFPLARINHDELVFAILNKIEKSDNNLDRLVIDCISDLESTFPNRLEFKNFVLSLIRLLSEKKVTSMFLYRIPKFFGSYEQPGVEITSIADTIISLKSFDIANRMKKGLFILKTRGREHKSKLQTVEITRDEGFTISEKGWTLEGLISGEAVDIKEPPIFFKLFYENEAEKVVNDEIVREFNDIRYPPPDKSFTSVRKPQLYTEFWSFRGDYGAGHANIRVISLPRYSAIAFRKKDQLHNLTDFFAKGMKDEIRRSKLWDKCKNEKTEQYDMVPNYRDFGLLCSQKEYEQYAPIKNLVNTSKPWTWNDLIEAVKKINEGKEEKNKVIGFALPYLFDVSDFTAFFLEILWSHQGKVMDEKNKKILINEEEAQEALLFINDLVFTHKISQNPYNGDFSSKAIFSRKRYSSIREFAFEITAKMKKMDISTYIESEKKNHFDRLEWIDVPRDKVRIFNLPKIANDIKCYSAHDVYCLGIVKEALSPEIGWIFIDSLTHPEWVRKRAKAGVGFPVKEEYLKNPEIREHDPQAYEAVDKILDSIDYGYKERTEIPGFYKIETIIHDGIKRLFIPKEREELFTVKGADKSKDRQFVKNKIREILKDVKECISEGLNDKDLINNQKS